MPRTTWRTYLAVVLVAALGLGLSAGCAPTQKPPAAGETPPPAPKKTDYSIVAGSAVGSWIPLGASVADLANKELRAKGIIITTVPGAGGVGNVPIVSRGEGGLGFSYSNFLAAGTKGIAPYDQKYTNLRAVIALGANVATLIAAQEVPYNNVKDLLAAKFPMKLSPSRPGSGEYWTVEVILNYYGVTYDDILKWGGKLDYVDTATSVGLFKDRSLDNVWLTTLPNSPSAADAMMGRAAKLLELEPALLDYMEKEWGLVKITLPAGMYKGQDKDIHTFGLPLVLVAHEDVPDEVTYTLAKVIAENQPLLATVNAMFKDWKPENAWKGTGIELHPGAKQFFQEKGWMPK
jgi:TRAP transporter TAXI family solute receptor